MPKINIKIAMPDHRDTPPPQQSYGLCEYVQELVDEIEAGYPSREAWCSLRRIFNRLARAPRLTQVQRRAFELAEPIILKYGFNDPRGVEVAAAYPHEGNDTFQYNEKKD